MRKTTYFANDEEFSMQAGEVPGEGWQVYLKQEEARLLRERYQLSPQLTPAQLPEDADAYLDTLLLFPPSPLPMTQLQVDWDRFVTFGERLHEAEQLRSLTPSPILPALNQPVTWPMTRHTSPTGDGVTATAVPFAPRSNARSRAALRRNTSRRLRDEPLSHTHQGRSILNLSHRVWYKTPSQFAVTQYAVGTRLWLANDEANYLHLLNRGLRVHRSTTYRLLCVENLSVLNEVLVEQGAAPIALRDTPPDWQLRWGKGPTEKRNLPAFLRAGYTRRRSLSIYGRSQHDAFTHALPSSSAQAESEDAGQAAPQNGAATSTAAQAASPRDKQDGDGLLYCEHVGEPGAPVDDGA